MGCSNTHAHTHTHGLIADCRAENRQPCLWHTWDENWFRVASSWGIYGTVDHHLKNIHFF